MASLAAQQKAKKMQEDFEAWIWKDPDRGAQLAEIYNRTQNDLRPRVFDGNHQTFPGMAADWQKKMRPHQRDAIYRVVQDGTALLAHEVGFGKTAVMVAGGMERKRLGLSRKPVYVVPKATHAQFREQFLELYPQAKVLFPEDKHFAPKNRREFLARVRTGDWDAIILTMDQFENIPVRPDTEAAWQERHVEELRDAFEASKESGDTKSRTHKQIETALKNERTKLQDLQADISNMADKKGEYFEDLGIDQIFVDEADNYKNLRYVTKMGAVKGLPQSNANRSWDMFLKTQYLQGGIDGIEKPGNAGDDRGFARQGVVFATGTPIANTIAEAWTMMRYLQNQELHRRGYHHFDAWARTYGRMDSGLEQTPQGKYKQVTRFANFNNLPELSALLQNVADIRVASEVPQMLEAQPRLVDREGKAKRIVETAPTYPSLQKYMGHLVQRAENMGKVDPTEDNMLKLSSDARKASLDIRMVQWPFKEPPAPNPNGKIPMAAANVAEIYKAEADNKGTQIVFLDLATPKGDSEGKQATQAKQSDEEGDDDANAGNEAVTAEEQKIITDAYNIIRRELIAKGVPADQIAFIHDHDTKKKKLDLFEKVRDGDVRVLLGSTGKLGVGVNVQDRAAAIHHIDVPWRPRDIEQREGRIVRQGNKVYGPVFDDDTGDLLNPGKGVKIFNYVQEGSFDEFMWQGVQIKGQAIKSLVKRYVTQRKVEDIDPLVIGAAEAKALASGDPRIMRMEELRQKVQTLRLERAAHDSNARNSAVQAKQITDQVDGQRRRLPQIEKDAELARKAVDAEDKFAMTVGAKSHDKRPDADKALKESMAGLPYKGDWRKVGDYGDLNVMAVNTDTGYKVALVNPATNVYHHSGDIKVLEGANVVSRIDNVLKGIANSAVDLRKKLDQSEESLSFYTGQVGQRFDGSLDLQKAERELQALRRAIEGIKDDDAPEGEAYEVEADTEVSAIINDSDDAAYDTARAKVTGEVMSAMQSGGRDFVMPTQAEIDEQIANELLKQPRAEPARAPEPVSEPEPAAQEVPERVVNEISELDTIAEPDATTPDPVADVESEPAQEPEYAAAAMTEPEPVQEPDAMPADPVADVESEPAQEPEYAATAMTEPEPAQEPDAMPADPVADVESVSEYDSWRKQQLETAETVFPTEERDALVSRLIDADEKVHRADGRDEEWLAAQREDLTDFYNDRGNAIGEVGARNEKRRLLQLATKFEAMAVEAEPPDAMPADPVADVESEPAPIAPTVAQYENAIRSVADYPRQVQDQVEVSAWDSLQQYPPAVRSEAEANLKAALESVKGEPEPAAEEVPEHVVNEISEPEPAQEPDSLEVPASQSLQGHLLSDQYGKVQFAIVPTADLKPEVWPPDGFRDTEFPQGYAVHKFDDGEEPAKFVPGAHYETLEEAQQAAEDMLNQGVEEWRKNQSSQSLDATVEPVPTVEPAAEPEYAAAMAMPEPEPAQEPDAMPADPVADVEPEAQEPEYTAADAMAEPEPEPAQEVDPVPSEPELEQRLQDCEALSIPAAASRVEEYIQQDMDRAHSALESAAAYAGLPSISDLPDNVERLELREDGSVVAVIDEDADTTPPVTEPVADMPDESAPAPDISDAGDAPISPPSLTGNVDTSAETTEPMESDPSVEVQPRWDSMSMAEKAAAIARYNEALENYRKQQELARLLQDEGGNADVVEAYCDYLRDRIREQKTGGPQSVAVARPKSPPAVDVSQVQLRKTTARSRSIRPGLQPRSRVARLVMGDVAPRQTPAPPVASVKEAMGRWPSLPQIAPLEPERELLPVAVRRGNEEMPESIEYRPGQEPVALGELPDHPMVVVANKRNRRGRRKPDEEENRATPQINLVVRAT